MDEIADMVGIFVLDIAEKYRRVVMFLAGDRLGPDDDALAGDLFRDGFSAFLQRQEQMDLQLRHRRDIFADAAVNPCPAQIITLRDKVLIFTGDLQRDIVF